jgi:hypothetical protein
VLKTVVFFIRNFWCGQCQDYTFASLSLLDPVAIRRAGVRVVVIKTRQSSTLGGTTLSPLVGLHPQVR